jgi:hypothetical protein
MENKELFSLLACDLVTGNFLLGRPRTEEYKALMVEFAEAVDKVNMHLEITEREKELFLNMSEMFYGGTDDMCEQLNIDKILLSYL